MRTEKDVSNYIAYKSSQPKLFSACADVVLGKKMIKFFKHLLRIRLKFRLTGDFNQWHLNQHHDSALALVDETFDVFILYIYKLNIICK